MMLNKDQIKEAIQKTNGLNNRTTDITVDGQDVLITIEITPEEAGSFEPIRNNLEKKIMDIKGVKNSRVILTAEKQVPNLKPQMAKPPAIENLKPNNIKDIICVASGKGGVGKSTIAAMLALSLSSHGLKVGLMDADIYGPSVPKLFGLTKFKATMKDKKLGVANARGLKLMSIGFLVDQDTPMIWRGPMVQSAIRQFLQDVDWGDLDVLIVDMPPGTGDAQLTMAQKVPLSGAVVVSTPQDLALIDARKGIEMFNKTNVPIIGLVENMSTYICNNCGHEEHIFGHGSVELEAKQRQITFLGNLPLNLSIREQADSGDLYVPPIFNKIGKDVQGFLSQTSKR